MVNIDKDNTVIIFGGSSHIEIIKEHIPAFINKYDCIGINRFNEFHKGCKYWIWSDFGYYTNCLHKNRNMLKDYNIVTTTEINRKELNNNLFHYEDNKIIYDDNAIVPYYLYDGVKNVVQLERNNKLCMYKTTLHSAINLAIIEGYENIILFGIELEQDWSHFYGHNIKRPSKRLKKMRELLYMFTKYINIYKTNNNSLELEYIDIDSLI